MNAHTPVTFKDNPALKGREDRYETVSVDAAKALKSWKTSLFSFEWLTPEGKIREADDLPLKERDKRLKTEENIKNGKALDRPVLGIGLMDNLEIGAGRDVFLTLCALGHPAITVHIPKSSAKDFKQFLISS
jgi:hypothetical protein